MIMQHDQSQDHKPGISEKPGVTLAKNLLCLIYPTISLKFFDMFMSVLQLNGDSLSQCKQFSRTANHSETTKDFLRCIRLWSLSRVLSNFASLSYVLLSSIR